MKYKRIVMILGVLLIIAQVVSYVGMCRKSDYGVPLFVGLYPENDDLLYPGYSAEKDLNFSMAIFAVQAGIDRFRSGFGDLTWPEEEWRNTTSTQYASAHIRESLGCSRGGGVGLTVYDTILTISYCFVGIIGVVLVVVGKKAKPEIPDKTENTEEA